MPSIAVDADGRDFAPEEVVKGVAQVSLRTDIQWHVGWNEQEIQAILRPRAL